MLVQPQARIPVTARMTSIFVVRVSYKRVFDTITFVVENIYVSILEIYWLYPWDPRGYTVYITVIFARRHMPWLLTFTVTVLVADAGNVGTERNMGCTGQFWVT